MDEQVGVEPTSGGSKPLILTVIRLLNNEYNTILMCNPGQSLISSPRWDSNPMYSVEHAGIEPTFFRSERKVFPLDQCSAGVKGIEPMYVDLETTVLPLNDTPVCDRRLNVFNHIRC
jgi:hypothetical protein